MLGRDPMKTTPINRTERPQWSGVLCWSLFGLGVLVFALLLGFFPGYVIAVLLVAGPLAGLFMVIWTLAVAPMVERRNGKRRLREFRWPRRPF